VSASANDSIALSPVKRALVEIGELRARIAALEGAAVEPIAIVGVGCRLPGGITVDGSSYGAVNPDRLDKIPLATCRRRGSQVLFDADVRAHTSRHRRRQGIVLVSGAAAIPVGQRRDALAAELATSACHVIGLDDGPPIASTLPLREMGLDLLMAVELRNVLVRLGDQSLPATLLFDYPHLDALSSHLYRAWGLDFDATPELTSAPGAAPADDDLADLSDEEAESFLLAELTNGDGARRRP
jgi:hypothetical protein